MRHRSMIGMARAAGLAGLTACGLLMNSVGPAEGQDRVGNSGDTTPRARPGGQVVPGPGQDTQMLIAHGLEMAIEGSTLQALAMQPGGRIGGGPGVGAPRPLRTAPGSEAAAGSRSGAPGTPIGARAEGPGAAAGVAAMPMTTGPSAAMLRQQAQHSFEDSDRLLGMAARDNGADQKFAQAATRYAATLRSFGAGPGAGAGNATGAGAVGNGTGGSGTFPSATSATGLGGTGNPVTGPGGVAVATGAAPSGPGAGGIAPATGGMTDVDLGSVAAINHEVKEALGALKIKQMFRVTGSTDSPSAQALMSHAREMEAQSRSAIQAMVNGAGATSGPVQALAQQANELILALQGTGG